MEIIDINHLSLLERNNHTHLPPPSRPLHRQHQCSTIRTVVQPILLKAISIYPRREPRRFGPCLLGTAVRNDMKFHNNSSNRRIISVRVGSGLETPYTAEAGRRNFASQLLSGSCCGNDRSTLPLLYIPAIYHAYLVIMYHRIPTIYVPGCGYGYYYITKSNERGARTMVYVKKKKHRTSIAL